MTTNAFVAPSAGEFLSGFALTILFSEADSVTRALDPNEPEHVGGAGTNSRGINYAVLFAGAASAFITHRGRVFQC